MIRQGDLVVGKKFAFIDESGDPSINIHKMGVSSHYVVAAVIVNEVDLDLVKQHATKVQQKYFPNGQLKSSHVTDLTRRLRILGELLEVPWTFCSVAVDKKAIKKDSGLRFRRSFVKYISGKLYRRLYESYPSIEVIADGQGYEEFRKSFKEYIEARFIGDLFTPRGIEFHSPRNNIGLQIADFVAGSVARLYADKYDDASAKEIFKVLVPRSVGLDSWPQHRRNSVAVPEGDNGFDALVRQQSISLAIDYLEQRGSKEEDPRRVVAFEALSYLVNYFEIYSEKEFVQSRKLRNVIEQAVGGSVSAEKLRNAIGLLRDDGILIASGRKGYKIPARTEDMLSFVEHGSTIIEPMLHRLSLARDRLRIASGGELDILGGERHARLLDLIQTMGEPEKVKQ
jgi:hypothetical protein